MKKNNFFRVSVITVCLNCKDRIEKTILSVINQTYNNVEYIIVDGVSNDGTVDIINKYNNIISYWISEYDEGVYDAMNKGIMLASGEWVIFMNAGDCFSNNYVIEKMMSSLEKNKSNLNRIGLIYGNALVLNEKIGFSYKRTGKEEIGINDFYLNIINSFRNPICHQAAFFRKKLFKEIGLYNKYFMLAADYEWFVRYFKISGRKYKTKYIDLDIVDFQMDGLSFDLLPQGLIEKNKIAIKYFPFHILILHEILFPIFYLKSKVLGLFKETTLFSIYRNIKYKTLGFIRKLDN